MKNKKIFVGAAVSLTLLINFPQVSADEVEVFGDDFDENNSEIIPFQDENEDFGPVLIFNDPSENYPENPPDTEAPAIKENFPDAEKTPTPPVAETPPIAEIQPVTEIPPVTETPKESEIIVIEPTPQHPERERILPPSRIEERIKENEARKKLKMQKARFIKLGIDDNYIYYLDKQSISWKRVPYSASEYMLDVWIRMIEKNPDNSNLPDDLSEYVNDISNGEIEIARERGLAFAPVDVEVLQHKKYFLEHYYLRPKTKQIQFLSELEVIGHPQNTISERIYDYKNWENLIPGSIESIIYQMTIKEVGKSGSSEKGHMTFADYLEEYARISIR